MKPRYLLLLMLLGAWLNSFAKTIPAGSTIYLVPGSAWGCKATYVIYCSGWNPQGYQIFSPVAGKPGVYQCVLKKAISSNLYFGASDQVKTSDGTGWIGDFCGNYKYETSQDGWSTATPCWTIKSITGAGAWEEVPDVSSEDAAVIQSFTYDIAASCVSETYTLTINASFIGDVCSFKLTGTQFARDIIRSNASSPITYTIKNLPITETSTQESVTLSLCSDGAGSSVIVSQTIDYMTPNLDCEHLHDTIEVCEGEADVILTASFDGDAYLWSNGETTKSISVSADVTETYTVEIYQMTHSVKDNLMANGDFETVPSGNNAPDGFTSSYNYVGEFDPSQYYSGHGGAANLFAITHNANYFWRDFADIDPHGGNYYALFDAGTSGYAWKATTADNPNLMVEKDSIYIFSYWAAYPNLMPDNSPAQLQFRISIVDENGNTKTQDLGSVYILGQELDLNDWYYQEVTWKAPSNSSKVTISVEDLNGASGGNDFCLDDIIFQRRTAGKNVLAQKDIFPVKSKDCKDPDPDPDPECKKLIYRKWDDVLFVSNENNEYTGYQWYCDGVAVEGATHQDFYTGSPLENDGHTYYVVVTKSDGTKEASCPVSFSDSTPSSPLNPGNHESVPYRVRHIFVGPHVEIIETIYENGNKEIQKRIVL